MKTATQDMTSSVSMPFPCFSSSIPVNSSIVSNDSKSEVGDVSTTTQFPTRLNNLSAFNRNRTASKDLPQQQKLNNVKNIKNAALTKPATVLKQNPAKSESSLPSTVSNMNICQVRTPIIHEALPVASSSIMNDRITSEPLTSSA